MSKTRELLELAAKACGYQPDGSFGKGLLVVVSAGQEDQRSFAFDPRNDDGDCARMEAALSIDIEWHRLGVKAVHLAENYQDVFAREPYDDHGGDRNAARRMASTRVAAEIQQRKG